MSRLLVPDASLLTSSQNQIDEKIEKNTQRIEECLNNINGLLKDLPSSGDTSLSHLDLEDRLSHVSHYHSIEKTACYDLDLDDLQNFFTNMSNHLAKNPGSEQSVLTMLIKLCSHTGLTLPWKTSGQGGQRASMMSLNVVNDEDEQMCDALWDEVRRALEDYTVACLYQLPITDDSLIIRNNRSQSIERLHLLTSTRQLCQQYRSLRVYCLNQLINDQLSSEGSSPGFPQIVNAFERISRNVITMIDGDFHLLISGIFKKVFTTFEIISSIYFDKLTDELDSVFDDLANDLFGQLDTKLTSRRQSDIALAGKLKDKINKSKMSRDRLSSSGTTSVENEISLNNEIAMSIVKLARALNTVDQHVYNLYLMSYTGLRGTSSHSMHSAEGIRGVLKSTSVTDISILSESLTSDTSDLPSFLHSSRLHYQSYDKAPQVVDKPFHHDKPLFLWQQSLKRFIPHLSTFVESVINTAGDACMAELTSGSNLQTIKLCSSFRGSKMEYPVTVWKAVADFVLAMETVFPLAQAGHTLQGVKQTYISTTMTWSKSLLQAFHQVVENTLQVSASNSIILTALSSLALIRNTLYQCDVTLQKDSEKQNAFVLAYHQTCQSVDSLAQQYVSMEVEFINNSLLHDADSFNWTDNKEFFEAERCSLPVQTWSFHMQMIRLELWSTCPPSNASSMFSDILRQTLDSLTLKYLNVYPSYRRTDQYRLDITVILYTVHELMFHVCSNSTQLLDLECVALEQPYLTIHSCCCKLLAALAIIATPLEDLYKIYKKGYQKKSRRRRQSPDLMEDEPGYYSQWLSWLQPDVIPRGVTRVCDMQTTTALYIQIKLLLSQPEPLWSLLVQVITMKEFTLPIMILTQPNTAVDSMAVSSQETKGYTNLSYQQNDEQSSPPSNATRAPCQLVFCDNSCHENQVKNIFEPFLKVLILCNKPSVLYNVLLPVINRGNQWHLLDSDNFYLNMVQQPPPWLTVILSVIEDCILPVITSTMLAVCQKVAELQNSSTDITKFLHKLPCGCRVDTDTEEEGSEAYWNELIVGNILEGLTEEVSALPISVCVMLEKLGGHMDPPNRVEKTHSDTFILQVLGMAVSRCISDTSILERCNKGKLSDEVLQRLSSSSKCVYAALSKGNDVTDLRLTKEQMSYLTKQHHTIAYQRVRILENIKHRESMWPDLDVDGGTADSFAEFSTINIVSEILENPEGERHLRQIYNLLANNEKWLYSSLDINETPPPTDTSTTTNLFVPDVVDHTDGRDEAKYNPLTLYNKIGNVTIDFDTMRKKTENMSNLLLSDLGLTDLSLSSMLQHRHDFQDVAYLEPNEKKHVESLKAKFSISN